MLNMNRSTLREAGVPPSAVGDTLRRIAGEKLDLHSFLLMRRGELAAEVYAEPFGPQTLHRMYSVTKSLVALAVGQLAAEGRLRLDDAVCGYFPEYGRCHPWVEACTVRHLLCMQSCHTATTYKKNPAESWVASFFTTPPAKPPGTLFHYDTSATHTLAALAERLSGKKLLDYLRGQCLDAIGFSKEAYILPDPFGVSMGGSGLMARPADLLLLGQLLLSGGRWQGRQLLDPDFLQAATSPQTPTAGWSANHEEAQGYGYFFWAVSGGGFGAYGKGGQYILCWPRQELVVVTTADTQGVHGGTYRLPGIITQTVLPRLDQPETNPAAQEELEELARQAALRPVPTSRPDRNFSGVYAIRQPAAFTAARWEFSRDRGALELTDETGPRRIEFGLGEVMTGQFPRGGGLCAASAGWLSGGELYLHIRLLGEECAGIKVRAAFTPGGCTIEIKNTCEMCHEEFSGLFQAEKRSGKGG